VVNVAIHAFALSYDTVDIEEEDLDELFLSMIEFKKQDMLMFDELASFYEFIVYVEHLRFK
jgi:hypothetical protein